MYKKADLQKTAQKLRLEIIEMIYNAGSGHSGGSLSSVEILTVLYDCYIRINPEEPKNISRDRFVLSKGHAAPALYAILAKTGFFDRKELNTLRQINSCLQGHPCMFKLPGVEMSTGSLGMGISVGVGMALSAKQLNENFHTYVLCGDGEMQEGQNWEAMMSASKWKLDNLTVIIDHNHVQLDGTEYEVMPLGSLYDKITSFGLDALKCDGHDIESLICAFEQSSKSDTTSVIIAETIKGKGVSFMEGKSAWHGKKIEKEHYDIAIKEILEVLS